MKKMLTLGATLPILLFAACSGSHQPQPAAENASQEFASLKDAYDQLSKIPGVSEDTFPDIRFGKYEVKVEKHVSVMNLDRQQIENTGNAVLSTLDRVPMKYTVNGATNKLAAGFVYAKSLSDDKNEVLIVGCSGEAGMYIATYGIANDSTVYALRLAPLNMQGQKFALTLQDTPDSQIYLFNFYE